MIKENRAHLKVLTHAIVVARQLCEEATASSQAAAALLDAVHNTPSHIKRPWCSEAEYLELYYRSYDQAWGAKTTSLMRIYDAEISEVENGQ